MTVLPTKARDRESYAAETLKTRLLGVLYCLGLLALGFVALQILSLVKHAMLMLCSAVLLAYLLAPLVHFFSHPIQLHLPHGPAPQQEARSESPSGLSSGSASPQPGADAPDPNAAAPPPQASRRTITLTTKGLPWVSSILVVYLLVLLVAYLVVSYIVPMVVSEAKSLSNNWPVLTARAKEVADSTQQWLVERLPAEEADTVPVLVNKSITEAIGWVQSQAHNLPPMLTKLASTVASFLIIPIMTFYLLADIDRLRQGFLELFPRQQRGEMLELLYKVDDVLGQFIRGQLLVALILGSSITLVLALLGVPYALTVGMFAGIFSLIPYMGPVIGGVPAAFIAYATGGPHLFVKTLVCMYGVHLFEGKVVVPTVVGRSVKLPPVVIMVSIFAGAELLGIIGLLVAVPTLGILRVLVAHVLEKRDFEESKRKLNHHDVFAEGDAHPLFRET
jgi:predicted PurR-regulated permease PerM